MGLGPLSLWDSGRGGLGVSMPLSLELPLGKGSGNSAPSLGSGMSNQRSSLEVVLESVVVLEWLEYGASPYRTPPQHHLGVP